MNNLFAISFVVLFLSACAAHSWNNTHIGSPWQNDNRLGNGDSAHWDAYARRPGGIRGLE